MLLEKPVGLQSPDSLRAHVLFLNVTRSEQDRMAGIEMPVGFARFFIRLQPVKVVRSEDGESLCPRMLMYNHRWAAAAIRGKGVQDMPDVHPVLEGFRRV